MELHLTLNKQSGILKTGKLVGYDNLAGNGKNIRTREESQKTGNRSKISSALDFRLWNLEILPQTSVKKMVKIVSGAV